MIMKFTRLSLIMKRRNKQFEADLEIAKKLQQELDESEEEPNKSKPKPIPIESDPLDENEWICKKCTLKNTLPDYKCDA